MEPRRTRQHTRRIDGRARRRLRSAALLATFLAAGALGCGATCDISDDSAPAVEYRGGEVIDGIYQTSSWGGPFLHYPGGRRIDIYHQLGVPPAVFEFSLSFSPNGVGERKQDHTAANAAGNTEEILLVNQDYVRVKNGTCSDFWLRFTAHGSSVRRDAGDEAQQTSDGAVERLARGADGELRAAGKEGVSRDVHSGVQYAHGGALGGADEVGSGGMAGLTSVPPGGAI